MLKIKAIQIFEKIIIKITNYSITQLFDKIIKMIYQ